MKAETAKLPGAGIGPKQCPRKCVAEKGSLSPQGLTALQEPGESKPHGAVKNELNLHQVWARNYTAAALANLSSMLTTSTEILAGVFGSK